ncbi:hypothetical protein [Paucisalibacillus sp. EB02]|uniref:hypothetical protein n=1 Tax=Paucisalibacillus sp. EB02 TaxID=1347087 RepID=UPI0005A9D85E|nr:hypothetical protein [Paucisalibacillus sp. EB02]
MRKWLVSLIPIVIVLMFSTPTFAFEETKTKYFGVGATVEEVEQATFIVRTKGEGTGEGFVFTPEEINTDDKITFQVSIEGKGSVFIKLVEMDANGKYIKEHSSPMILLTSDWKEYHITAKLSKSTDQVDVLVITDGTQQTEFKFRDANILK